MSNNKLKVLIVDDDQESNEIIQSYFKRRGYGAFTTNSAKEALSIIKQQKPQVMFLDVSIADMKAIDLVKALRRFNTKVKIILMSDYELDAKIKAQFKELDIFRFVQKPIIITQLEEAIINGVKQDGGNNGLSI